MDDNIAWYQMKILELSLRLFLLAVYIICEVMTPFQRILQPEELWLYKYPVSDSYVPMYLLSLLALLIPIGTIIIYFFIHKEKTDLTESLWCFSLLISLNGAVTNTLKIIVGRPRPDYVARCFPDGQYREGAPCTGNYYAVLDGRKSFPSGHSSLAFASFGFLSLYLAAKLRLFTHVGKSSSIRLIVVILPLFFAMCVAASRTCDYHHHWQDVLVGSLIGLFTCYICYFQYYPPLASEKCYLPWKLLNETRDSNITRVKEI